MIASNDLLFLMIASNDLLTIVLLNVQYYLRTIEISQCTSFLKDYHFNLNRQFPRKIYKILFAQ